MANTYEDEWNVSGDPAAFMKAEAHYQSALDLKEEYPEVFSNRADLYFLKYKQNKEDAYVKRILDDLKEFCEFYEQTQVHRKGDLTTVGKTFRRFLMIFFDLHKDNCLSSADKRYLKKTEDVVRSALAKDKLGLKALDSFMRDID